MHKHPYFSVIIPTYNRAHYIPFAIRSVLAQDFSSFEIIVVDDGSTDETMEVVRDIQDLRVCYYKKINEERAAARNYGIKKARGEFITFLDSDDLLKRDHFSTAKSFIENNHPTIFHQGYDVIDEEGKVLYPWQPLPSPANNKLLDGNFLSCLGIFIKREVFASHLFNEDRDLSGSEDYELWLRLASRYDILTCSSSTAQLVNHMSRSVVQINLQKLIKRIDLLRFYMNKDQIFINRFNRGLVRWSAYLDIYVALHLALLDNFKFKSLRYALQGLLKFPLIILSKRFWVIPTKIFFQKK